MDSWCRACRRDWERARYVPHPRTRASVAEYRARAKEARRLKRQADPEAAVAADRAKRQRMAKRGTLPHQKLTDGAVALSLGLHLSDCPPELIEAQRAKLLLTRALRRQAADSTHQRCSRCHELKPLTDFHVDRARRNGRTHMCRPCGAAYKVLRKERQQHEPS